MIVTVLEYGNGAVDFAGAFTMILLASEFFIPLRLLGSFFHIAMNGMSASDKIFRILDMAEEADGTQSLTDGPISADLRHVAFSYEMEKPVLREISMTIPAGSFVSLVGVSGCGKSTVSGLLTGKLRQTSGEIRINQIPLTDIKERDLMQSVTLIRHNSYLFKGTVRDNLLMGNPDASESQMKEALEKVRLLDFLDGQKGSIQHLMSKAIIFPADSAKDLLSHGLSYITHQCTSWTKPLPILMWKVRIRSWKWCGNWQRQRRSSLSPIVSPTLQPQTVSI